MRPPPQHDDWPSRTPLETQPPAGLTSPVGPPIVEGAPVVAPKPFDVPARKPMSLTSSIVSALWRTADPVGVGEPSTHRLHASHVVTPGGLRRSARRGAGVAVGAFLYAALSSGPNRVLMVLLTLGLLASAGGIWLGAAVLARSPRRQLVTIATLLAHLTTYAVVAHLDGGVNGPLGLLLLFAVAYLAVSVAFRPLLVLAGWAGTAFVVVAALAEPPRAGALVQAAVLVGTGLLCARHSAALTAFRHRLAEISRIDPATGYLNRHGFDQRLDQELSRAARSGQPLTLMIVELDLDDEDPAVEDDEVAAEILAGTSRALRDTARAHDAIGRLGPDEFALILTDTGPDAAAIVVERLRGSLAGTTPARVGHASFPREAAHRQALHRLAIQRSNAFRFVRRRNTRSTAVDRPPTRRARGGEATRRRPPLAIADLAGVAAVVFGAGVVHAASSSEVSGAGTVLTLCLLGLCGALAAATFAPALAHSRLARFAMTAAVGPVAYMLTAVAVAIDGGAASPLALGLLAPLPLVALQFPRRIAAPLAAGAVVTYLGIAATFGSPGLWHLLFHLSGMAAVTVACARRRETAARQRAAFTDLSLVDGLTDTLNRRGLEERFTIDVARAHRQGGTVTVFALDLDTFDDVHTREGRGPARELLRWAAGILGEQVRGHDVVGRLGDDEFVLLVSNCAGAQAEAMAARLRERMVERTGVGVGFATLGRHGTDFEGLYRFAVTARGTAKTHGAGAPSA